MIYVFLFYISAHKPRAHGHKLAALNAVLGRGTVLNLLAGPLLPLLRSTPRKYTPLQTARRNMTSFPREKIRRVRGLIAPPCSGFSLFSAELIAPHVSEVPWGFRVGFLDHTKSEGRELLEIVLERNEDVENSVFSCGKPEAFICSAHFV